MSNACSPLHVCLTFSFMQVPLALNGRHKTFPHSFRWPLALALALPFLTSAFLSTPQSFSTGCVNVDCGATYDDDPCFELSVSFCVHSTICALLGVSPRDRRLCVRRLRTLCRVPNPDLDHAGKSGLRTCSKEVRVTHKPRRHSIVFHTPSFFTLIKPCVHGQE